jgi:processive 1,2-diacylglycerol beta-glucosyltransferase
MHAKDKIIHYASRDKYKSICLRLTKDQQLADDLFQEFMLVLLQYDERKLSEIRQPDAFLFRILKNMACSSTSDFYKRYKRAIDQNSFKEYMGIRSLRSSGNKNFTSAFHSLYWYDREILKLYAETGSAAAISEKLRIPYKSLQRTVAQAKQKIKTRMKQYPIKTLLPVQYNVTGLDYHRLLMPFERLQKKHPGIHEIKMLRGTVENNKVYEPPLDSLTDEQLRQFNIVYVLRQLSHDVKKIQPLIDRIKSNGLKMVFDIDDYWHLPKEHYWHQKYKEQKVSEGVITTLKQSDAVVTTTHHFAEIIAEYNQNVTVLPNCINPDDLQFKPTSITSPRLRFGWIGGVFHRMDIKILEESMQRLYESSELKDRWQICLGGYNPNPEFDEIEKILTANYSFKNYDSEYFNYLMQRTPAMEHVAFDKPYRRLWGKDVRNYGSIYNDVDVCLVPLVKNSFNECKSELKIVEAGTMKKTVICSDILPYNQWIKDGVNGILIKPERNFIDWFTAIRKLILNPGLAKQLGDALHKTVTENFNLDKHNKKRDYLLQSLL